jgi:hypothetical protein
MTERTFAARFEPASPVLNHYTMDPTPYDWSKLLAPFCPPLPRQGAVFMASYFGDAFVEDADGAVWWVNGIEERVDRAAINRTQFIQRVEAEHLVMLKARIVDMLIVGDKLLKVGMVYGLKTPRSEGGKYHVDNLGAAKVEDAFAYMGQRFLEKSAPATEPPAPEPKPKSGLWGKKR